VMAIGEVQLARSVGSNREIVAIQPAAKRLRARGNDRLIDGLARSQHLALREVDVEIAVVVVVEQRDAAAHHFREIEIAGHAVEVGEVEAGCGGAIDEPVAIVRLRRSERARGRCVVSGTAPAGGDDQARDEDSNDR